MTQYIREQPRGYQQQQQQGPPTGYYQQPQGPPAGYYEKTQGQPRDNRQQMQQLGPGYPTSNAAFGIQFLAPFSTLSFQQEASVGQALLGYSAAQKFNIFNEHNQLIMRATENSEARCHRICCGSKRAFLFQVTNLQGQEIIRISREFKCFADCCCWCAGIDCCAYEALIESAAHGVIGRIRQKCSFIRNHYVLMDASGTEQLEVVSPYCICQGVFCCCCENKFTLFAAGGEQEIGAIFKEYAGVINQAFTGAEKYTIRFPVDLPPELKAVALGALFLINLVHFGGTAKKKGGTNVRSMLM